MKKIINFITNHSLFIVILSILLLLPAFLGYEKTKINYDILVYLPDNVETVKGQSVLTDDYGIGAFSFVLTENLSNHDILKLENKIKKIEGVSEVISVVDITDVMLPIEILPDEVTNKLYNDNSTIIMVTFKGGTSNDLTTNGVKELRKIVGNAKTVSGMTSMVLDIREICQKEMLFYVVIAVILCLIILTVLTDSYLVPVFLLSNIGVAILYNLGSNIFLGEISYITKAITAVLQLGVTTDFSIFLYHKYENAKEKIGNKKQAMNFAISETLKSVVPSSLTTIAGFLALCTMYLTLGKDIGIVMAKGVLCGLICVVTLFPSLLLVFDNQIEKTKHKVLSLNFDKFINFILKRKTIIFIIFLILILPAVYGNSKVEVYYKLDKSLPKTVASSVANKRVKDEFGITSPEMILVDKNMNFEDLNLLIEEIKHLKGIDMVISPSEISKYIPSDMLPDEISKLVDNEKYKLIIVNSSYEVATKELNNQIKKVDEIAKKYDKNSIVAGEGPLMKDLTTIADHDFKMVNYASIIVIFIIMLIVLKQISLPIILIISIEFAIFVNMSISYFTGTTLPFIASIVIGTIQLGATIDYAILLSTKYLEERKNNEKEKAIKNTLNITIPSIILSALCFFAATIGVGLYTKMDMIGSICELLARGSIISMLTVIIILPILLVMFDKLIIKNKKDMKVRN